MKRTDSPFVDCPIPFPSTTWRAKGLRAVDGDTLCVQVDRGFWDVTTMEIRLRGIDAVELNDPSGRGTLARTFTADRIVGQWLTITTHMDPDKYGRLDLATSLRSAGFAKPALARASAASHTED